MNAIITAVYEKGLLRPLSPLNLSERQTVRLQVLPAENLAQDEGAEAVRALVAAGLMRPRSTSIPPSPMSEDDRHELAVRLSQSPGKSLSEIILEDRGEG
jgi:predicted DNA-binding antitoxin AbrB/MazE fold protein